jgi:Yip1-like protein
MDVTPPPSSLESAPAEPTSLAARLLNIYVTPNEVFDEIKNAPVQTLNWLIPLILVCIMGVIYTTTAFSQEGVLQAMQEQREKAMQKNVAAGKMTQAQADQTSAMTEKFMSASMLKIFGAFGAAMASAMTLFLFGLILWLIAMSVYKARVSYMKLVEVCGLGAMIDVLHKAVCSFLVAWKGNMLVTDGPTTFLDNPSMTNKVHVLLSTLSATDIWWLAVLSLGLSKAASIGYGKAALWIFGIWFGFRVAATLLTPS